MKNIKISNTECIEKESMPKRMQRGRLTLSKGNIYTNTANNRQCELIEYIDEGMQVLIRYLDSLLTEIISIKQLENVTDIYDKHINIDLTDISDEYWEKAQSKYEAIRPLLQEQFNSKMIEERANSIGVTKRTIYRWLQAYNSLGSIAGLVDKKRGWQEGGSRLTKEQDNLIQEVIEQFYLHKQRPTIEQTIREVFRRSIDQQIDKPSKGAVRLRVSQISEREKLRKRGQRERAKQKFNPAPHNFPNADYPLSVVQIDHTPVDLILVDNKYRKPIGRPFLTLAIDVYSRMITGYYLSLDAPSVTSVGMCVTRSILPKDKLLLEHSIYGSEWNVFGYPNKIHVDNGSDFRSMNFSKSCEAHGITLEFRPVARPQYGGHIERLIGTFMKEVHGINGTTFSNIKEKDTYDSEKEASLTLAEFETWLLTFITKVYHKKVHSALGRSPSEQWKIGIFGDENTIGIGIPTLPNDEQTLLLDFLPCFHRTIQHFGVTIDGLRYYDQCLNVFINESDSKGNKKQFLFRRDPRDISRIWFYDPILKKYFTVPFANQKLPSMSLWEHVNVRKVLKDKGISLANEEQIYVALTEMKMLVEKSSQNTKKARRQEQRSRLHKNSQKNIDEILPILNSPITRKDTNTQDGDDVLSDSIDFGYVEVD